MGSAVTFAQLPTEEPAFLAYLAKTGEVWARALRYDPESRCEPGPVCGFLEQYASQLREHASTVVFIGLKPDVLNPTFTSGNTDGEECRFVSLPDSCLLRYARGEFSPGGRMLSYSHLGFDSSFVNSRGKWQRKPDSFIGWANNALAWVRRNTPEQKRLHGKNYSIRATAGVAARKGLKVL